MLRAQEAQMRAWGLFLFLVLTVGGCASGHRPDPWPDDYGLDPLPDFESLDRAGVEGIKGKASFGLLGLRPRGIKYC